MQRERVREKEPVHYRRLPIYFFRGRLRRGTCREGKRLSPRAKAKHRKSLKRACRRARTMVRFGVARPVNSYVRAPAHSRLVINEVIRKPEAEEIAVDNVCCF